MNARPILVSLAAGLLASVAACTTVAAPPRFDLAPVAANGQDLVGIDSTTLIESRQPGSIVSVRADNGFAEFGASFIVAVQNKGAGQIEFGPQNISATANGQPLAVLAADELDAQAADQARSYIRATTRAESVDLNVASESFNREYRYNNFGGCPAGQGNCQIASADNGSVYRQDRISREVEAKTVAAVAQQLHANRTLISRKALRASAIAPNEIAGGVVMIAPPISGGRVDISITVNGQKHAFSFNARPA